MLPRLQTAQRYQPARAVGADRHGKVERFSSAGIEGTRNRVTTTSRSCPFSIGVYPLVVGAETISTEAGSESWLRIVRRWDGLSRANIPAGPGCSSPPIASVGVLEITKNSFLVAFSLIVLGDRRTRWNLDEVDPERLAVERAAHERPITTSLELVTVRDRIPVSHAPSPLSLLHNRRSSRTRTRRGTRTQARRPRPRARRRRAPRLLAHAPGSRR